MSDQDWSGFISTDDPAEAPTKSPKSNQDWSGFISSSPDISAQPEHAQKPNGEFAPVVNPLSHPVDFFRVLAAQSSFNPDEQARIYQSVFKDAEFGQDENGQPLIRPKGGEWQYINMPGLSANDVIAAGMAAGQTFPLIKGLSITGLSTKAAPTLLGMAGRNAAIEGTTQAGVELGQQAAGGEFNPSDVAGATIGAYGGTLAGRGILAALEGSLNKAAHSRTISGGAHRMIDRIRNYISGPTAIENAYGPEAVKTAGYSNEFRIPYTLGQYTNDRVQQGVEENILKGGSTRSAQQKLSRFITEEQIPSQKTAVESLQSEIARGSKIIQEPVDAGAQITHKIHESADNLWNKISDSYDQVGHATIDANAAKGLHTRLIRIAKSQGFEVDPELAPATRRAMKIIADGVSALDKDFKPASIRKLNTMRKRFLRLKNAATNPEDRRQIIQLLRGLDERLDRASRKGLFSGDPTSLQALRAANSLRRKYGDLFGPRHEIRRSGRRVIDQAGKFIEDIAEGNPNPHEVINAIFGANSLYKRGGPETLDRVKNVVGDEEWNQLRQAAFMKMFGKPVAEGKPPPAGVFLKNLRDPGNRQMLKKLFTREEIAKMERLGNALKRAQPEMQNPSGTAASISQILHRTNALRSSGLIGLTLDEISQILSGRDAINSLALARPLSGLAGRSGAVVGRTAGLAYERDNERQKR